MSLHWDGETEGLRDVRIEKKGDEEGQHRRDFLKRHFGNFQEDEQILLWGWTPFKKQGLMHRRDDEEGNHLRILGSINTSHGRWENVINLSLNNSAHQIWEPDFLLKIEDMILEEKDH